MKILQTERLALREFVPDDHAFILQLLNEPGWLRYIGDRGLRTADDARDYIEKVPMAMYARAGFGLWAVHPKDDTALVGMCGLIRRDTLPDVDIGFAFLERHQGRGYAVEAAAAVLAHGRQALGLARIVAITDPGNTASIRVLEKIGLSFEKMVTLGDDPEPLRLFATPAA